MTRIPFIDAAFPDQAMSEARIKQRLTRHYKRLAARKAGLEPPEQQSEAADREMFEGILERIEVPWAKAQRISHRAAAISDCASRLSPLSQMKGEDRKRLEVLRNGVDVVAIPSEHRADEIAAELHADFPWLARATEHVWHGLRHSVQSGEPGVRIRPLLLDGPPAIAKSTWARQLAGLIGVPGMIIEATTENASFGLAGSQRGWSNAAPGRVMNLILRDLVANPVVIVDEVEKAGDAMSDKGRSFSLTGALLPLLEPVSSRSWSCPYFECAFDMSWIIWVLTANDWRQLPEPLLSRCPPIQLEGPSHPQLLAFARRQSAKRGLTEASIDAICAALDWAQAQGHRADLRRTIRLLENAERLQRRPPLQ